MLYLLLISVCLNHCYWCCLCDNLIEYPCRKYLRRFRFHILCFSEFTPYYFEHLLTNLFCGVHCGCNFRSRSIVCIKNAIVDNFSLCKERIWTPLFEPCLIVATRIQIRIFVMLLCLYFFFQSVR